VCAALEDFLRMEAAGWKGRRATALLSDERAATFTRNFVRSLANEGLATIESLYVGNRPVAMQVLLRSGHTAFTWKVAYDQDFRDFSPGILLLQDLTAALLAEPQISRTDSCCYDENSYIGEFWKERQPVADMLIDLRRGGSLAFLSTLFFERSFRAVRGHLKSAMVKICETRK